MEQAEFQQAIKAVFAHSPAGSGDIPDQTHFTNDGVLGIAADNTGKIGFGIASGLTPTHAVLPAVDNLNRSMNFGHYWLTPGADENNYSLICGFKFQYRIVSTEHVIEIASTLMQHHATLIEAARRALGSTAHRQYWLDGADIDAQALVLLTHLG